MKITLDLDQLLDEGKITQEEYQRFTMLAFKTTASLAFNLLVGFGVIAVSGAVLALVPAASTAIFLGLVVLFAGVFLLTKDRLERKLLANMMILIGALMSGGGIIVTAEGSLVSILGVTLLFAIASVVSRSSLLSVLAVLLLSSAIGVRSGYFHAGYFLMIREPLMTILLFTLLASILYPLSKKLPLRYENIITAAMRSSLFMINLAFWVGSLWGAGLKSQGSVVSADVFAIIWALALVGSAIWAWKKNLRWLLNSAAIFGGIHFYTQWFEHLGAQPGTVLLAGLMALGFALGLRTLNLHLGEKSLAVEAQSADS